MNQDIKVITICGSMRYTNEMMDIAKKLELEKGYAVIQCVYNVEGKDLNDKNVDELAKIHRKKIDVSDAIYVVNVDGYIGNSARSEIEYAKEHGKEIIYHEEIKNDYRG